MQTAFEMSDRKSCISHAIISIINAEQANSLLPLGNVTHMFLAWQFTHHYFINTTIYSISPPILAKLY